MAGLETAPVGGYLVLDEHGQSHLLDGHAVRDGELLDLLTDCGWITGHYRSRLHPDMGLPAFELHLGRLEPIKKTDELEHAVIYLPSEAVLRRRVENREGSATVGESR